MENERELLERIRKGEGEAAGAFFDAYFGMVYGFVYTRVFHRETAEDIVSQVFMKVLPHLGHFDADRGSVKSLLFRAAQNAVIDHYRSFHKHSVIEAAWDIADISNVEQEFDNREELAAVREALADMLPTERSIVVMHVWDGLSHSEIANLLGKRADAVKMSYSRAIRKLRTKLSTPPHS